MHVERLIAIIAEHFNLFERFIAWSYY